MQVGRYLGTCERDMDIACPNCAATYRVPDTLLAGGKPLRCAACGHEWVPQASPPEEAIPDLSAGALLATPTALPSERTEAAPFAQEAPMPPLNAALVQPQPEPRQTNSSVPPPLQRRGPPHLGRGPPPGVLAAPRRAPLLPIAWGVSVILVMSMVLGLWLFREEIAQAWPPFARLAGAMGG